ncbi:MAG: hypothetical protein R2856_07275 [Caldilineaceae bacterium]
MAQKLAALKTDWFRQFIDYDPRLTLASVDVPVLALYGGRDMQVPASRTPLHWRPHWPTTQT